MFEHRTQPLLSKTDFHRRVILYAGFSFGLVLLSLLIGMIGYRVLEDFTWTDAFLNASMLLGGMVAINELHTGAGKIFAGTYVMYCGLVVIFAAGLLAAPIFHRFLHKFYLEMDEIVKHKE